MKTQNTYEINWSNIDLSSIYQRNLNILEPYNFDMLLLEISCNIKKDDINSSTVATHAKEVLKAKYEEALDILNDNLNNIVKQAKKERG